MAVPAPLKRLCTMLCMALALVFAGTSLSSVVDAIQHAPGATAQHSHLLFSELADEGLHLDDHDIGHHDADQHAPSGDQDDGDSTPHAPGGHHHHGDSGSGLLAMAGDAELAPSPAARLKGFAPERHVTGLRVPGPERPPKTGMMSA